jgi:hypothetical protein
MFDVFGVVEVEVDPRAHGSYFIFVKLIHIMGEVIPADPDFSESILFFENSLALIVITTE